MTVLFFFFQAEDGIRDIGVTGVQTCALPISARRRKRRRAVGRPGSGPSRHAPGRSRPLPTGSRPRVLDDRTRSEERRVGKEGRSRWLAYGVKKKMLKCSADRY